ncbi:MAG: GAF domain-containing protein [Candidatus Devosia phytovorans]|uniref:GAF domain-containing protein n=1 Tax=Candidatus Devosia phytovorans TaxID=3121372 RepID=A0AAJ5VYT7_9HYPH|nr:GAF domain-containing protein [Devosia sp.]WEK06685.1 MAG: GAF domain-containing protein [Devosia sp.]
MTDHTTALAQFNAEIALAKGQDAAFNALQTLVQSVVGAKLFTVMIVDMEKEESSRAFTSHPVDYPTSGTKPLNYGPWFDLVHKQRAYYVANTIEDISKLLFDYELINALGCQSIVNMPVFLGDEMLGSVNMLNVEGYFTEERVQVIRDVLEIPAKLAMAVALR